MEGKIIKAISNDYTVLCDDKPYVCKARGKFRNLKITPLAGDNVIIDKDNIITQIKKRRNELIRPAIANIDQAVILISTKQPDFSSYLLDKLLAIIEFNNIKPIICFTKLDLLDEVELKEIREYQTYYQKIGYEVYLNYEVEKIKKTFENKVTVFTGQSGVGKSTLLNKLDPLLNLRTGEISLTLDRGKNTTTHVELLDLYGGLVADTPGFSSIDLRQMTNSDIRDCFIEFDVYKEFC